MLRTLAVLVIALGAASLARAEEVVVNDEWSIRPKSMQSQSFTLKKATSVEISITPVKHADKGVSVHVVPGALWDEYKAGHATLKAVQDANTERARSVQHVVVLKAGTWVLAVENSENLLEHAIVRAKITVDPASAIPVPESAKAVPTSVGQCVDTLVKQVEESGNGILYANGIPGSAYDGVPGVAESKVGDSIHLCLVSVPKDCPAGDDRGKVYKATNKRTGKSWQMPDSRHSCGGA